MFIASYKNISLLGIGAFVATYMADGGQNEATTIACTSCLLTCGLGALKYTSEALNFKTAPLLAVSAIAGALGVLIFNKLAGVVANDPDDEFLNDAISGHPISINITLGVYTFTTAISMELIEVGSKLIAHYNK